MSWPIKSNVSVILKQLAGPKFESHTSWYIFRYIDNEQDERKKDICKFTFIRIFLYLFVINYFRKSFNFTQPILSIRTINKMKNENKPFDLELGLF